MREDTYLGGQSVTCREGTREAMDDRPTIWHCQRGLYQHFRSKEELIGVALVCSWIGSPNTSRPAIHPTGYRADQTDLPQSVHFAISGRVPGYPERGRFQRNR
jgi:hypothetical protein